MKHSKFTKSRINTMFALATGTMVFSMETNGKIPKGKIAVPDFCKILGINQKAIQNMNKKAKQLRNAKTKTTG